MKSKLLALGAVALVAGCDIEVAKTPIPTGGSKADGIVELSYEVGSGEVPVVDWDAAQASARKRCKSWAYKSAEAFEGTEYQCIDFYYGSYNCLRAVITRQYQCI